MMGISLATLPVGKILVRDIYDARGRLLLPRGTLLQSFHIERLLRLNHHTVFIGDDEASARTKGLLPNAFVTAVGRVRDMMERLMLGEVVPGDEVEETVDLLYPEIINTNSILTCLRSLRKTDEYTFQHSVSVCVLAVKMGQTMKIAEKHLRSLGIAGLLHDIGKSRIPPAILNKAGELSREERKQIVCHPIFGYEIVRDMQFEDSRIGISVLQHHEHLDGKGYPLGVSNGDIHLFSRIVSVADVFDALTSERLYRHRLPIPAAIEEIIDQSGSHLDPLIARRLLRYFLNVMPGEQVLLNNGELATVVLTHEAEPTRPLVRTGDRFLDLRMERHLKVMDIWN
jgi:putative nucleotidyltransferase with HDIG domain